MNIPLSPWVPENLVSRDGIEREEMYHARQIPISRSGVSRLCLGPELGLQSNGSQSVSGSITVARSLERAKVFENSRVILLRVDLLCLSGTGCG